jgi:hypothetical protein
MAEGVVEPDYAADESTKNGYVHLKAKIGGLKVKPSKIFNFRNKHPHPEGKNAEIEVPKFHARGFNLTVIGGTAREMKGAHYNFQIRQLPFEIEADDCYITAEDGWIHIFLKKSDPHQSWEKYIRDCALETAEVD